MMRKLILFSLLFGITAPVALAAPDAVRVTRKISALLIHTGERLPNRKALVCLQRNPKKAPAPGWLRKVKKVHEWVPFKKTRKNRTAFKAIKAKCISHAPAPSECIAPQGFVGISSAETFAHLSDPEGKYFLCNDIEFPQPIAPLMNSQAFKGTLDGNGKSIRGLQIIRPNEPSIGLFRVLQGATIKNLRIIAPSVQGKGVVGVLAGISTATIERVVVEGGGVVSERYPAGSLVGVQLGGNINASEASASVTAQGQRADMMRGLSFPP